MEEFCLKSVAKVELRKNRESHSNDRHVRGQPRLYSNPSPDPDFKDQNVRRFSSAGTLHFLLSPPRSTVDKTSYSSKLTFLNWGPSLPSWIKIRKTEYLCFCRALMNVAIMMLAYYMLKMILHAYLLIADLFLQG
jgi:hypothetical protein